jgi:hypothetical protein
LNFCSFGIAPDTIVWQWLQIQFGKTNCAYLQYQKKQAWFPIKINEVSIHDGVTDSPKSDSTDGKVHQVFIIIFPAFFDLENPVSTECETSLHENTKIPQITTHIKSNTAFVSIIYFLVISLK